MSKTETEIIVCVGSGGVGKTTVAASLGVWGALEGKKVLVLTVDPARRLATTFNLNDDGSEQKIEFPEAKGELWASVLNPKNTFDQFVQRAEKKGVKVESILNNKLYQQLSTTLSGSQEFTSLEKLYSAYETAKYDLIVLDTPPSKHAIDFLLAPQKIAILFNETITRWFRQTESPSFFQQILNMGTQKALQALQILTGADFVNQLRDFFIGIEGWQNTLHLRTIKVHELLKRKSTVFNLVTAFDEAKLAEAKSFAQELKTRGYHLDWLTINRSFPDWLPRPRGSGRPLDLFCQELNNFYENRLRSFRSFEESMNGLEILLLPEYDKDISDLNGLKKLVRDYKWIKKE